jgi:hypothetical protein
MNDDYKGLSISDHIARLSEEARNMLLDIRDFVLSLPNVIEEIRPHRLVYSKGFNTRIFMDIEPVNNILALNIKTGARVPPTRILLRSRNQLQDIYSMVKHAYDNI